MTTRLLALPLLFAATCSQAHAQMVLGKGTSVVFATAEQAKEILTSRDDFVRCMSPFDRAARMKTDRDVSEEDYLEFVGKSVLEFSDVEKQRIAAALDGIHPELETLDLPFPRQVLIVKTTGNEEGAAAYTRANAIIFPKADLRAPVARIQKTLCHELFHILSRADPDLREKLYAAIGFVKCNEVVFPPGLKPRKITNPDAPRNDHCIRLQLEGKEVWAVPVLFSRTQRYDIVRGGEFFNYLRFQFLLVQWNDDSSAVVFASDGQGPRLVGLRQVSGFFEQVGKNTRYVIHPEEILADNFALLVLQERELVHVGPLRRDQRIGGVLRGSNRVGSVLAAGRAAVGVGEGWRRLLTCAATEQQVKALRDNDLHRLLQKQWGRALYGQQSGAKTVR